MRLTEVQNKYQAAKNYARRYKLWAEGKERDFEQKWQNVVVDLQDLLQLLKTKVQEAFAGSAVSDSAVIKELDKAIQALRDSL
jgi:hypothetical protein